MLWRRLSVISLVGAPTVANMVNSASWVGSMGGLGVLGLGDEWIVLGGLVGTLRCAGGSGSAVLARVVMMRRRCASRWYCDVFGAGVFGDAARRPVPRKLFLSLLNTTAIR